MHPRKNQNKGSNKKAPLIKSQKRKLKKLEEDREKALLSAKKKSDLLNLIRSWRNAGDQRSKAGVLSDEPVKENDNSDYCMGEPTTPEIHIPVLHSDSDQLIHPNELDSKVMMISA
ncbi:Uncharacterized protein Rs2_17896 [Raphanus sativus]|nr:hypothetical protein Rs2_45757 [Raphanus sativus]KAJ4903945.1 Uncharacterized protein Rs2_17896 [Raphanus sativus]